MENDVRLASCSFSGRLRLRAAVHASTGKLQMVAQHAQQRHIDAFLVGQLRFVDLRRLNENAALRASADWFTAI